jgi:hypothetical protein
MQTDRYSPPPPGNRVVVKKKPKTSNVEQTAELPIVKADSMHSSLTCVVYTGRTRRAM